MDGRTRHCYRLALAALLITVTWSLCGWLFGCGCTWPWAGASSRCNVHAFNLPHCPWCVHFGWSGAALFGAGVLAVVFAMSAMQVVPAGFSRLAGGVVVALASYSVLLLGIGLVSVQLTGYPLGAVGAQKRQISAPAVGRDVSQPMTGLLHSLPVRAFADAS